jgi:hypothetical protein
MEATIRVLDSITAGPRPRHWSERHYFSAVAAELARNALFDR